MKSSLTDIVHPALRDTVLHNVADHGQIQMRHTCKIMMLAYGNVGDASGVVRTSMRPGGSEEDRLIVQRK